MSSKMDLRVFKRDCSGCLPIALPKEARATLKDIEGEVLELGLQACFTFLLFLVPTEDADHSLTAENVHPGGLLCKVLTRDAAASTTQDWVSGSRNLPPTPLQQIIKISKQNSFC